MGMEALMSGKHKKSGFVLIKAMALFASVLLPGPLWAEQPEVGMVARVVDKVYVTHEGQAGEEPVKDRDTVFFLDSYKTAKGSRVKFLFLKDESLLTLGENTTMQITENVHDPDRDYRSTKLNVVKGKVRVLVGRSFRGAGSTFEVHTPTSVVAAKGTYFIVGVEEENGLITTEIVTLPGGGIVEVTPLLGSDMPGGELAPSSILLTEGQFTVVSEGERPAPPEQASTEYMQEMIESTQVEDGIEKDKGQLPTETDWVLEEGESQQETAIEMIDEEAGVQRSSPDLSPFEPETVFDMTEVELFVSPACPPGVC
jgi:hypothetical protein